MRPSTISGLLLKQSTITIEVITKEINSLYGTNIIIINIDCVWKLCFYVRTIERICLFSDDFNFDSTLILTTIAVK
jgi:hypothetical protein